MNTAQLTALPMCDMCEGMGLKTTAKFDGPTVFGPWAYMCESCFFEQGSPQISSILATA